MDWKTKNLLGRPSLVRFSCSSQSSSTFLVFLTTSKPPSSDSSASVCFGAAFSFLVFLVSLVSVVSLVFVLASTTVSLTSSSTSSSSESRMPGIELKMSCLKNPAARFESPFASEGVSSRSVMSGLAPFSASSSSPLLSSSKPSSSSSSSLSFSSADTPSHSSSSCSCLAFLARYLASDSALRSLYWS